MTKNSQWIYFIPPLWKVFVFTHYFNFKVNDFSIWLKINGIDITIKALLNQNHSSLQCCFHGCIRPKQAYFTRILVMQFHVLHTRLPPDIIILNNRRCCYANTINFMTSPIQKINFTPDKTINKQYILLNTLASSWRLYIFCNFISMFFYQKLIFLKISLIVT